VKRLSLLLILSFLLVFSAGCGADKSVQTSQQNNTGAVTKELSPEEKQEAIEKSTSAAKKVDVDLTTIDEQLESIGEFDIVDESGLE